METGKNNTDTFEGFLDVLDSIDDFIWKNEIKESEIKKSNQTTGKTNRKSKSRPNRRSDEGTTIRSK